MLIGCPVTIYGYVNNLLSLSFIYSFLGSAIFSSCTLLVYSLISTKVVGVVSIHKESGLIRIGYLTFWGKRRNAILSADQIIPPSDINDEPEKNKSSSTIKQTFILTKVKSEIIDKEKFRHIFGFTW
ncbi:unnamed protein product [Heterobilharzia americana]|nr:unnamed protein product [Heterobilharzia americana]